jgi:hypothetical protein
MVGHSLKMRSHFISPDTIKSDFVASLENGTLLQQQTPEQSFNCVPSFAPGTAVHHPTRGSLTGQVQVRTVSSSSPSLHFDRLCRFQKAELSTLLTSADLIWTSLGFLTATVLSLWCLLFWRFNRDVAASDTRRLTKRSDSDIFETNHSNSMPL